MNRSILNEIYCTFYEWIEKDINFDILKAFNFFLKKDRNYLKYVPKELHKNFLKLEVFYCSLNDKNDIENFRVYIYCCCNMYIYDFKKLTASYNNEQLYYKSILSHYYVMNFLNNKLNMTTFNSLNNELNQVIYLIKQFYENMENRSTIKSIISQKIKDIFNRYDFRYSLPLCLQYTMN